MPSQGELNFKTESLEKDSGNPKKWLSNLCLVLFLSVSSEQQSVKHPEPRHVF